MIGVGINSTTEYYSEYYKGRDHTKSKDNNNVGISNKGGKERKKEKEREREREILLERREWKKKKFFERDNREMIHY